jgi:hypothetical protein
MPRKALYGIVAGVVAGALVGYLLGYERGIDAAARVTPWPRSARPEGLDRNERSCLFVGAWGRESRPGTRSWSRR